MLKTFGFRSVLFLIFTALPLARISHPKTPQMGGGANSAKRLRISG